jgi:uncharacterized membrane protein HdeD (DUF308 family)
MEEIMTSATVGHGRAVGGTDHSWAWTLVLGVATACLGVVILANPFATARTLAILVAVGILVHGLIEVFRFRQSPQPTATLGAGVLLVIGGLVALFWPGITLWVLALVVGFTIVLAGATRLTAAIVDRHAFPAWRWLLASGALSLILGIVAVAWPKATIVVLAVIFGLQITLVGLLEIAVALELRRRAGAPRPVS